MTIPALEQQLKVARAHWSDHVNNKSVVMDGLLKVNDDRNWALAEYNKANEVLKDKVHGLQVQLDKLIETVKDQRQS